MSFLASIAGFAGISPAAVLLSKGGAAGGSNGSQVQQLLPSGADFAALVRALSSKANADPEGLPVPAEINSEPIEQLEETIEKIMGVPVTVEPLASIQDWGLFEIRLNDIPREIRPEGLAEPNGGNSVPPLAFLLAQMPTEAGSPSPSFSNTPGYEQPKGAEETATPLPMAFLIYPNENSNPFGRQSLKDQPHIPAPEGNADLRLDSQLLNTRIEIPVPIESLTSTGNPNSATEPILFVTTGPKISIDTPSDEALLVGPQSRDLTHAATINAQPNLSGMLTSLPEGLSVGSDVASGETDGFPGIEPGSKPMVPDLLGTPTIETPLESSQSPATLMSAPSSSEGAVNLVGPLPSNPPNPHPAATVLEANPDKPGLAEVAKTLRRQGPQTVIEPLPVERMVAQKLVVPSGILEILKTGSASGAPLRDDMKALDSAFLLSGKSLIAPVNPNPVSLPGTQPSSTTPPEIAAQLQNQVPEANPLSPVENPTFARPGLLKLTSLSSQAKDLQFPAKILEGEPALKITSLVAKIFSQKTEAPAPVVEAKPDGKLEASTAEPKGPLAASIKPAVPENPSLASKEPATATKPEAALKVPILIKPAPDKAPALIAETEQRVARSLLSTLVSGTSRIQSQPSGNQTHPVKEKPDRAAPNEPTVNLAPKPETNRLLNARRAEPPRRDSFADRQVESPVRTAPVSGASTSVSAAPAASAAMPSSGASLSNSATQNLEVVQQVSQALQSHRGPTGSEIRIRLVPENLGEVHIKIAVKDGTLVAEIRASSEVTREILSRETHKIQALLGETGAKVEHVVVRTGGFGGEAFQSDRSTQREPQLPADREGNGRNSGRDAKDTGSSQQEKERDPHSPWERWEKFA